jgi:hypothetical protein
MEADDHWHPIPAWTSRRDQVLFIWRFLHVARKSEQLTSGALAVSAVAMMPLTSDVPWKTAFSVNEPFIIYQATRDSIR